MYTICTIYYIHIYSFNLTFFLTCITGTSFDSLLLLLPKPELVFPRPQLKPPCVLVDVLLVLVVELEPELVVEPNENTFVLGLGLGLPKPMVVTEAGMGLKSFSSDYRYR